VNFGDDAAMNALAYLLDASTGKTIQEFEFAVFQRCGC